ncbi:MAG: hypothetical protein HYY25_08515 [Candidatus Wallbacteria bacterium]|nr:hypothetical protein [Candidatus Wallbacteria bacterium]
MTLPETETLPTAAAQVLARRAPATIGTVEVHRPAQLARTTGAVAATLGVAAMAFPLFAPIWQPLLLACAIFAGIHVGLGTQARVRDTLLGFIPAAAVAQWVVPAYPAFGFLIVGALAGWAAGAGVRDGVARLSVVLGVALATLLGNAFISVASSVNLLAGLVPAAVVALAAGALQGTLIGLGSLPRHLVLERDPVELLYEESRVMPGAEMRDYLERSMRLYRQVRRCLSDGLRLARDVDADRFLEDLTQLMTATFRLARRWREIELFLEQADAAGTRQRLAATESKLASLADPFARRQYEQVAESLRRRLEHLDDMVHGRERVIGSLNYYYTTLEEMLLSLMRLKASDAQSTSLELNALAGRVRSLNSEMELTARAVEELDFAADTQPPALPRS